VSGNRWIALALATGFILSACGGGPEETFEERVSRLRYQYEIKPTAVQNVTLADGRPAVAVDLLAVFQGAEPLEYLTLVLEIQDENGVVRTTSRFTIDTRRLMRGVSDQVSASIPDIEVREGEHATVELEAEPPEELRGAYPEYRGSFS